MTSRERVYKTLNHEPVDRPARDLWALPGVMMFKQDDYNDVITRFPGDLGRPECRYGSSRRAKGEPCVAGISVDAWGCEWHVGETGVVGEVKCPPLADWSALDTYTLPWELLDEADFSNTNRSCNESDKFMLGGSETRPFERMQYLRGTENLFMDLAYGVEEVYTLRDMVHEFNCREMEMWAKTDVDALFFMDDWGTQISLLISPDSWRNFFKPLYRDYCDIAHSYGKKVFYHSDGFIEDIYPDLIEIGVNALNSQLFCMDIEKLGCLYGDKITFWGEIDRQFILPFGNEEEVRAAVRRVKAALWKGTGVIAQCEWGNDVSKQNIITMFDEWDR